MPKTSANGSGLINSYSAIPFSCFEIILVFPTENLPGYNNATSWPCLFCSAMRSVQYLVNPPTLNGGNPCETCNIFIYQIPFHTRRKSATKKILFLFSFCMGSL